MNTIPSEITRFRCPVPRTLITTNASRMLGKPLIASVNRITTSSTIPPKYPVSAPTRIPTPPDRATTSVLIHMVAPMPFITREKMSRPKLSVPKKCCREGAAKRWEADMDVVL